MLEVDDKMRREMAERLRECDSGVDEVLETLGAVCGQLDCDVSSSWVEWLADVIDRPMCEMKPCRMNRCLTYCTTCDDVFDADINVDLWRYCPTCGAEIMRWGE